MNRPKVKVSSSEMILRTGTVDRAVHRLVPNQGNPLLHGVRWWEAASWQSNLPVVQKQLANCGKLCVSGSTRSGNNLAGADNLQGK
jgi:hypothetical protein